MNEPGKDTGERSLSGSREVTCVRTLEFGASLLRDQKRDRGARGKQVRKERGIQEG